ncbi:uncharacterized protein [Physcomitrium patens]|uniref:uncharacterized protein isoform X3 n=1 Tax=Physcomitrium patens TaxID=3218 RepID=UPI000D17579A|nr:uncharacterized protein LOC112279874 isoform X3 [Physcomitrium patens]|eukprot:XP_024370389.1 uncharacterized protein LOC112279874 isoform X3 [Physcomitrella patens]
MRDDRRGSLMKGIEQLGTRTPAMKLSTSRKMKLSGMLPEVVSAELNFPVKEGLHLDSPRGHFRSLSAPEKAPKQLSSWDFSPRASLNQALKESIQSWRWKMRFMGTEDRKKRILNNRRALLENDVAQLQTQLEDEKAVRQGLERALVGVEGAPSAQVLLSNLDPQTQKLITEVSSLEKEVMHLEQHVLTLCREVLNQRLTDQGQGLHFEPSSPYSHAEKRQALAQRGEIRFKSEKMQMDSQPRNAFPQSCQRNMSVAASQGFKRPHSSISNEHHKTRHNSLPGGTFYSIDEEPREMQDSSAEPPIVPNMEATPPSRSISVLNPGNPYSSLQVVSIPEHFNRQSVSNAFETSTDPTRSLAEPTSSNPNKLSEELVRCMAAIYCKLADPPLTQPVPISPSSSTSSSTTVSSSNDLSNGSWSPRWRTESAGSCELSGELPSSSFKDQERDGGSGCYGSMVEVPWICVDKDRLPYAARALRNFRTMVEQLEQVNPGKMNHEQKAYLAYGIPRNRLKRLSLLQKAAYKVGAHLVNAHTIEHSILGCGSIRPSQWFQSLLSQGTKFKTRDERRAYGLHTPEPLVCFALCSGGRSDPAIRVYTATNVKSELESAKLDFLQASIRIRGESKVLLPRILEWYARELMMSPSTLLQLVANNVPGQLQAQIQQCIQAKPHKSAAHCLEWIPHSFGFRYIFVRELALQFPASAQ